MEAKLIVFFAAFCLLCICHRGCASECSLSSIVVVQYGTADWAHGQPVYTVNVTNKCRCAQSNIKLFCGGFETTLEPDIAKLRRPLDGGELCLLNDGKPVVQGQNVTFSYAWSKPFGFRPVSSRVAC
ncbi:hypothetical protein ACP70R_002499 [Stipagrostis hirtigluma subsp. patula]